MNILVEDISETRKKAVASITGDETASAEKELIGQFAQQARVPGFRPGKAPANLIKTRYKKDIAEELKRKLTSEAYQKATTESEIQVLSIVSVDEADFVSGEDAEVSFTFDVRPTFELPDYKGLPITVPPAEPTEEEIKNTRDHILNQRAEYDVTENAAEKGNYVKLDYEGKIDDQLISEMVEDQPIYGTQNGTWEEAGSEDAPGIRAVIDGIIGMKAGDEKDVEHVFADDFQIEALKGKTATYHIKVEEVREKKLPEINEEFLKSFNVETEEAFQDRIKDDIRSQKEQQVMGAKREQVIGQLSEKVDFPLPESVVEGETNGVLSDFIARNMQQGVTEEQLEEQKDKLFEGASKAARDRVKAQLLLSAIAEKEEIKVEDQDIQQAIMQEAMQTRVKPEDLVKQLREDRGRLSRLQQNCLHNKALDFLVSQATVTEAAPEEGHEHDENCDHDH
ncbi:trigger factor [Rubellicoccus peritrichatus]|uniref:Trigger factor n=1 Tax=Rubellicoccus peritrichatus TaxID=3080537 RepID=A0AAQ3LAB3_9BACT|nr:trigger factor [Puniceicoccus sp. CR14]WOO42170.1 trigger factor [Puniceicoccus sp. CR14]